MENTLIDGRYLLLAAIGSGGEARVFRARDTSMGNEVAVRLTLQGSANPENAPASEHPGWVQFLGDGADPEYGAYQVFELLKGETLSESIRSGPLDANGWRAFVDQSLEAVEAVHDAGQPHGDLNADNFFQTASGWKLLELPFHRLDAPKGRSAMFGSIYTLAPEQIDGAKPSVGSDIYSLGCLYYYAASGTYPHTGSSDVQIAYSCLRSAAPALGEKAPGLPAPWSDWVMQMIATKPTDRFASIAAARHLLGVA